MTKLEKLIEEYQELITITDLGICGGFTKIKELGLNPISNKLELTKARSLVKELQISKVIYYRFINQLKSL